MHRSSAKLLQNINFCENRLFVEWISIWSNVEHHRMLNERKKGERYIKCSLTLSFDEIHNMAVRAYLLHTMCIFQISRIQIFGNTVGKLGIRWAWVQIKKMLQSIYWNCSYAGAIELFTHVYVMAWQKRERIHHPEWVNARNECRLFVRFGLLCCALH